MGIGRECDMAELVACMQWVILILPKKTTGQIITRFCFKFVVEKLFNIFTYRLCGDASFAH